jgi:hypothetical protein
VARTARTRSTLIGIAILAWCLFGASPASAARQWRIVPSPPVPAGALQGAKALGASDVWGVGFFGSGGDALAEHWNGSSWTIVPTAPLGSDGSFSAVDGSASNDVWAMGNWVDPSEPGGGEPVNLAEHWNGLSWTKEAFPSFATGHDCEFNRVLGVRVLASDDVWAVGEDDFCDSGDAFIVHFDGSQWTRLGGAGDASLFAVDFASPSLGWAVGSVMNDFTDHVNPLIETWNGSTWTRIVLPIDVGSLRAVTVLSSTDAWAVGGRLSSDARPILLHWNGHRWRRLGTGAVQHGTLDGLTARGPHDVTAVGATYHGRTLVLHWDGVSWSRESSPNGTPPSGLLAATSTATSGPWAVGSDSAGTLIERRR